jgi:hypothetical protein
MKRMVQMLMACSLALGTAPVLANLIVNGSFETPVVPAGGFVTYPAGSTAITGWTVVGAGPDSASVVSTSFMQSGVTFQAQDGQQWIDLAGYVSNAQTSGVAQNIATTPGGLYEVSFWVGSADDNVNNFFFPSTIDLSINGGPRVSFTNPTAPPNMLDWRQFVVPFVATSSSTSITFYNGGAPNNFLSGLDNVTIEAVPEPATGVLALGALVASALIVCKK